ncbi:MAG: Ig-like domain-containing protein [Syntrophales bacterium LBB04]|nr:Ig-like domain-containing protein [Syntrophales bacterium LBB04]
MKKINSLEGGQTKRILQMVILALSVAAFLSACGGNGESGGGSSSSGGSGSTPTTAPTVSSTTPTSGALDVAVSTSTITAVFSKSMDPTTISTGTFLVSNGTSNIGGTVTYSGSTAVFTPASTLSPSTTYTATITSGAKDTQGNAMANSFSWAFTTRAQIVAISTNDAGTMALSSSAEIYTWGAFDSALGRNPQGNLIIPPGYGGYLEAVPGKVSLSQITAGASGAGVMVAAKSDGSVWAWGSNFSGTLGNNSTTDSDLPVQVLMTLPAGVYVKQLAAGWGSPSSGHILALRTDGKVMAWGDNSYGQLGDGTTTRRLMPVEVSDLTNVKAISAGNFFSMAIKNDGTVWAWGRNVDNELGLTGDGVPETDTAPRLSPVQLSWLTNAKSVSAGSHYGAAVDKNGAVWVWGWNPDGRGNGTCGNGLSNSPVQVTNSDGGAFKAESVTAGGSSTLALKADGTVWGWGSNFWGQLGNGTYGAVSGTCPGNPGFSQLNDNIYPVQAQGLTGVTKISIGDPGWSMGLKADGTVWAWGLNTNTVLGWGTEGTQYVLTPAKINGL